MRRFLFACSLGTVVLVAGCFGRTGIGFDELESSGGLEDAGDTGVSIVEAGADTTVIDTAIPMDDAAGVDRFIDIWDVFPIPEGGVIGECATCVRDNCGSQVNECINSPACRNGLACVATKCLGGGGSGGFDIACVTGCFGGDFKTAGLAITTFTCVTNKCGAKCGSLLGGLPGVPGSGGSGGSGGGSGGSGAFELPSDMKIDVEKMDPSTRFCFSIEAFSPWRKELQESACQQGLASCPQ